MTPIWRDKMKARLHGEGSVARILRNTGWMLAGKGFGAVLSLIYLAMATRSLGPERFGQFTLILGLAQALFAFVCSQTWRIVIRFGTPQIASGRRAALDRLILFSILIDLGGGIIGCVLATAAISLLAPHFGWSPDLARNALWFAFVMLLAIRSTAVGTLRLHDCFRDGALADSVTPASRMIGALLVMLAGPSVNGFLLAWAGAEISTTIVYWILVQKRTGLALRGQPLKAVLAAPREHAGFWRFTFFTNLGTTLAAVNQQCALLAVGYFAGPAAAGFFRLAHQLGQALAQLAEMLSRALFAELSRVRSSYGGAELRALFVRTNRIVLIGGLVVVAVIVLLGKPALLLIAGKAYLPVYPLLILLGMVAAINLIGVSFEPVLLSAGKAGQALAIRAVDSALLVALLVLLMPRYEEFGAAVATLIAAIAGLVMFRFAAYHATRYAPEAILEPALTDPTDD